MHGRGMGRPFRVEEMVTLLQASGFPKHGLEAAIRLEVHRKPWLRSLPGCGCKRLYEVVDERGPATDAVVPPVSGPVDDLLG